MEFSIWYRDALSIGDLAVNDDSPIGDSLMQPV